MFVPDGFCRFDETTIDASASGRQVPQRSVRREGMVEAVQSISAEGHGQHNVCGHATVLQESVQSLSAAFGELKLPGSGIGLAVGVGLGRAGLCEWGVANVARSLQGRENLAQAVTEAGGAHSSVASRLFARLLGMLDDRQDKRRILTEGAMSVSAFPADERL